MAVAALTDLPVTSVHIYQLGGPSIWFLYAHLLRSRNSQWQHMWAGLKFLTKWTIFLRLWSETTNIAYITSWKVSILWHSALLLQIHFRCQCHHKNICPTVRLYYSVWVMSNVMWDDEPQPSRSKYFGLVAKCNLKYRNLREKKTKCFNYSEMKEQ